ncbi:hypothetical protein [Caloramator sp. mosi_1]
MSQGSVKVGIEAPKK